MTSEKPISAVPIEILDILREDNFTYTFKCSRPEGISWEIGANGHFSFRQPTGDKETDKPWQRHMTVTSHPGEDYISFTTRIRDGASSFKNSLKNLRKGDRILIYGLNNRMPMIREDRTLVFITMGVALASCRPYFLEYGRNRKRIPSVLCLAMEGKGVALLKDELARWRLPEFTMSRFSQREEFYGAVEAVAERNDKAFYYVIGSDGFLENMCRILLDRGIPADSICIDKKKGVDAFLESRQS